MNQIQQTEAYAKWFAGLRDSVSRARINIRIRRLSLGNPGDAKPVGEGVSDMKNAGPSSAALRAGAKAVCPSQRKTRVTQIGAGASPGGLGRFATLRCPAPPAQADGSQQPHRANGGRRWNGCGNGRGDLEPNGRRVGNLREVEILDQPMDGDAGIDRGDDVRLGIIEYVAE